MKKSDRIKSEVSLRQVAESAGVRWDLKKSNQRRGDWWAPCPFHAETTASFHVVEPAGKGGYFKCFGCHEGGTVIDFVMLNSGIDFIPAVRQLAEDAGIAGQLSPERQQHMERERAKLKADAEKAAKRQADNGQRAALDLWSVASRGANADNDVLIKYLTARGVQLPVIGGVPSTVRYSRDLVHREGGDIAHRGPAMVSAIGRTKVLGVHRTWITPHGRAKYATGKNVSKQWLGRTGELMGQPCVLSPPSSAVVIGEGIETTLTAFSALLSAGKVGWSAEAGLSRGAITGPSSDSSQLWTPRPGVSEVLILGEGSKKNPAEARDLYHGARDRLTGLGLSVLLTVPHGRWDLDHDFADLAAAEFVKD